MSRTIYDKYTKGSYNTAEVLKIQTPNQIGDLIKWLESKLSPTEKINIETWINELFYVVVEDQRKFLEYPAKMRIGFTVDVKRDIIFWSGYNEEYPSYPRGGNCFVRTAKWKKELKNKFGNNVVEDGIYQYRNVYPVEEKPVYNWQEE
jgi:hypothetical protein